MPAIWQKKVRDREPRPVHSSSEIAIGYVAGPLKKRAAQQNESNRVRSAIGHTGSLAACQAAEQATLTLHVSVWKYGEGRVVFLQTANQPFCFPSNVCKL